MNNKTIDKKIKCDDKYRALFMASRDAVMTLEPPSWKFTSGNPATIAMFKAKDEVEFLSFEPWKLSPEVQPDGRPSIEKAKAMIEEAMEKGVNLFEWVHKRIDGEEFFAEVLLSRVEQSDNSFLYASVRDITERKRLQNSLEKLNHVMIGRELSMKELKQEIIELKSKLVEKSKE